MSFLDTSALTDIAFFSFKNIIKYREESIECITIQKLLFHIFKYKNVCKFYLRKMLFSKVVLNKIFSRSIIRPNI